jgi:hypothetical protein
VDAKKLSMAQLMLARAATACQWAAGYRFNQRKKRACTFF